MTETKVSARRMNPWLATLAGIIIVLVLTSFLGAGAHPGIVALALLIATAAGGYTAAMLSGRREPAWATAAFALLVAVSYIWSHQLDPTTLPADLAGSLRQRDVPLWLMASVLGSPLLGGRIGEAGAARR